jgi:hypothetical protein
VLENTGRHRRPSDLTQPPFAVADGDNVPSEPIESLFVEPDLEALSDSMPRSQPKSGSMHKSVAEGYAVDSSDSWRSVALAELPPPSGPLDMPEFAVPASPLEVPAAPDFEPATYQSLSRWKFVLVVFGVWIVTGAAGAGIYDWWFHSINKTPSVFVLMMFVLVCALSSLLTALVQGRPLVAALSIALMSGPLAAMLSAAALYGAYVFQWVHR